MLGFCVAFMFDCVPVIFSFYTVAGTKASLVKFNFCVSSVCDWCCSTFLSWLLQSPRPVLQRWPSAQGGLAPHRAWDFSGIASDFIKRELFFKPIHKGRFGYYDTNYLLKYGNLDRDYSVCKSYGLKTADEEVHILTKSIITVFVGQHLDSPGCANNTSLWGPHNIPFYQFQFPHQDIMPLTNPGNLLPISWSRKGLLLCKFKKSRKRVSLSHLVCVWFRSTDTIPWV